jgi:peptidyl-prolyl cis-trans isomerase D
MFDLFRSRDKAVRILLGALLVLVGLSMLTYLIPSYNTGGPVTSGTVIAKVGDIDITQLDVQRIVQNAMRNRQIPPEILGSYVPQVIDNLVTERALDYEARRIGLVVTDQQVSDAIRQYVPSLFQDGKFVGNQAYSAFLAQQNLTIPEFEMEFRRQLLVTRMRDIAVQGVIVTPQEIEQEFRKRNEKVKIQFVKIPQDKFKSEVEPTQAEIEQNFKINQGRYNIPERRNLAILIADQAKIEQSVNPTDADLQKAYNQNQQQFRVPEEVKVRHILLMTQGKPAGEEAAVKAKAEDILKQVKSGANFTELVKKYSEDPGKATNNGEYTVQRNGQMVKEFEDAAFRLKPGDTEIVKTSYGYHVFQVVDHNPARLKPFDEVKTQLAADWKKQRVNDLMQQISDKAQSMLQKDPAHPEKVAAELNMQVVRADNVEAGKPVPEVGINNDFDQSISGLKKGEVSAPVALPGNKIALAVVTDLMPARPATLAEVQNQVRDAMVQNRLVAAVQTHAKELMDKAKAAGGDLEKVAKSMGLTVKTSDEVMRNGAIEGLGSASYIQEAFHAPEGTVFGPIPTPDGTVIAKVISHVQPDMTKLAEQRNAIRDELKTQKGRDRNNLFEAGLREALIKEGKIKVYDDVVKRMVANYQGGA